MKEVRKDGTNRNAAASSDGTARDARAEETLTDAVVAKSSVQGRVTGRTASKKATSNLQ